MRNGIVRRFAAVVLGSLAVGCSHHDPAATAAPDGGPAVVATADTTRGRALFVAQCAACHGATGVEGGVGPALKDERKRKNRAQTAAWIENPQPPMPKLYPSPLTAADVDALASYVQSL